MIIQRVPSAPVAPALRRVPSLDALRGIACLMVLIAHVKNVGPLQWLPDELGVAGVGIFFALSGFLITRILLRDKGRRGALLDFYNRRAVRILPVYYLTLAVVALAWKGREIAWAGTFTFNFLFLGGSRDYFSASVVDRALPPVAHFWSLCVEEHFYWVWPLVVMILPRRLARTVPLLIIALTPFLTFAVDRYLWSSGLSKVETEGVTSRITPLQLVALSVGSLAAFFEPWLEAKVHLAGKPVARSAIVAVALATFALGLRFAVHLASPSLDKVVFTTALHLLCGAVFLLALSADGLARAKPLCAVGTISYGAYLYHLPVYARLGLTDAHGHPQWWMGAVAILLTFALAWLSYRCLEAPLMARARHSVPPVPPRRLASLRALTRGTGTVLTIGITAAAALCIGTSDTLATLLEDARRGPHGAPDTPATPWSQSLNTIFVGSSHAEMGCAPPAMRVPTHNVASNSQDLWYSCGIAKQLRRRLPNLRQVVFELSVFSFRRAIFRFDDQRWREALFYNIWGIRSQDPEANNLRYGMLGIEEEEIRFMKEKASLRDEPLHGWHPRANEHPLDPESGKLSAKRHTLGSPESVPQNIRLLVDTIGELGELGVRTVLIATPTHASYRDALDKTLVEERKRSVEEVLRATPTRFLDFSADPRFDDADFFDADHLNKEGALKFTRLLDEELMKLDPNLPGSK